jgi:hypothetical protein
MKYTCQFIKILIFLIAFVVGSNSKFGLSVSIANERINADLLVGEWKMVSLYDPDLKTTKTFNVNLKNGIIFTEKEAIEVIHNNDSEKPYKMAHKYELKGDCVMLKLPENDVCWRVKTLTKHKLILDTPIGEFNLIK